MDSHLDVSLGGDNRIYPKNLQIIVARTGAHAAFRHMTGGLSALRASEAKKEPLPKVIVAVSKVMLAKHALDVESKLPFSLRVSDREESIRSCLDFLGRTMGIGVYQSPPESLQKLARRISKAESWLLDIDVDYVHEMQRECYTRIFNPGLGVLQSMTHVMDFIERSKPEVITLSEARVSAIRDARSNFSTFMKKLRRMGYQIEEGDIFASDVDVIKGIAVCREFYRTVSNGIMIDHLDEMMRGDLDGFRREEEMAAKEFFRKKGYIV